jgi:hypothetical protein
MAMGKENYILYNKKAVKSVALQSPVKVFTRKEVAQHINLT